MGGLFPPLYAVLAFVLGLAFKVLIGEEGDGGATAGDGRYTRLYST